MAKRQKIDQKIAIVDLDSSSDEEVRAEVQAVAHDLNEKSKKDWRFLGLGRRPHAPVKKDLEDVPLSDSSRRVEMSGWRPLAERMRPTTLQQFVGQSKILGKDTVLGSLLSRPEATLPSLIFWGGPGTGKTTLAGIIGGTFKHTYSFKKISAVTSSLTEVRDFVARADNERRLTGKKALLFIDEIHRFNKLQQDVFLPHVEAGTITLLGATTENPSFTVNSALLSRARVIVLSKLAAEDVMGVVRAALTEPQGYPGRRISPAALEALAGWADGDARIALNSLEMALEATGPDTEVGIDDIAAIFQKSNTYWGSEQHYDVISALHKSMRGSDVDASLYWVGRMIEAGDDPLYIARRLIRFASEDVGLADPAALPQAVACYQGCHFIGYPECDVLLGQCAAYLAQAPKSVAVYRGMTAVKEAIKAEPNAAVPLHLRNAPTALMHELGYAQGYLYPPDHPEPINQDYLPASIGKRKFWQEQRRASS